MPTVSEELPLGTLSVEVRSVNHRYLDIQFRLPDEMRSFEPAMRELVAARLSRGKVECRVGLAKSTSGKQSRSQLNTALLDQLMELDRHVRDQLPGARQSHRERRHSLARHRRGRGACSLEQLREQTQALLERSLSEFTASRAREGEKLKALLLDRVSRMEQLVDESDAAHPAAGCRISGAARRPVEGCHGRARRGSHPPGAGSVRRQSRRRRGAVAPDHPPRAKRGASCSRAAQSASGSIS